MLAAIVASAVLASPASALTAPELYVRTQRWDTHEETGPWIPLASAPALNYLGGYEIGFKLQESPQRVALTVTGVPDGKPTQPSVGTPYCVGRAGTVGTIVPAGPELQFEGIGRYSVQVFVGPISGGATDCLSGPSSSGSFSVPVRVAPTVVGTPFSFRAVPPSSDAFVGLRAPAPPGGRGEIRCTLGATVVPEGDDPHEVMDESVFTRPGVWACAARGVADGRDDNFESVVFGTPWSAPLAVEVHSDFRRRTGRISRLRSRRPRFTFVAEWPELANGGRAKVTLFRVTGCKGKRFKLRKAGTFRGRFGAKRARITMRRPRKVGFYLGRFAFSGTHLLRRGADPNPMLLVVQRKRMGFSDPGAFPRCPGYKP